MPTEKRRRCQWCGKDCPPGSTFEGKPACPSEVRALLAARARTESEDARVAAVADAFNAKIAANHSDAKTFDPGPNRGLGALLRAQSRTACDAIVRRALTERLAGQPRRRHPDVPIFFY